MSSSNLSSPIHKTNSGNVPLCTILERIFYVIRPLLTPCILTIPSNYVSNLLDTDHQTYKPEIWISSYLRFNFYKMLTTLDRNRLICKHTLKMIQQFLCLKGSKISVNILIMPNQRTLLCFYCRSICSFSIQFHNRLCNSFPIEVCQFHTHNAVVWRT